jgi:signal transduction histidine kinase
VQPFLERVVHHLERVQRVAGQAVVDAEVPLDYARFEAFVVRMFEEGTVPEAHWCWHPWYLRQFVNEIHWDIMDGAGGYWRAYERATFIEACIAVKSNMRHHASVIALSAPRLRLLIAMVGAVSHRIGGGEHLDGVPFEWQSVPRYCERLGLTRMSIVIAAGTILLRLRGGDRLRWLLALEISIATSNTDSCCLSLESARWLSKAATQTLVWDPERPQTSTSISSIYRWIQLGALRGVENPMTGEMIIDLTDSGRDMLDELADDATPFRILVRAFLEDDRDQVLRTVVGTDPAPDRATSATLRHARMVAHEVRNALLPVQHALEKIWGNPTMAAAEFAEPRRRIEEGLARLHRFVDDSLRLTPIAAEEVVPFSVMEAIEEARRQCNPAPQGGILVEARPGSADPRCRGHRGRFVVALLNLLRNAVQVGGSRVRVAIGIDARTRGRVVLSVKDDGPGIPEAQQASIFENGVSYRDGGSGHGLSYVRMVVEEEMGGVVRLVSTTEPRGAWFELDLPTDEVKQ